MARCVNKILCWDCSNWSIDYFQFYLLVDSDKLSAGRLFNTYQMAEPNEFWLFSIFYNSVIVFDVGCGKWRHLQRMTFRMIAENMLCHNWKTTNLRSLVSISGAWANVWVINELNGLIVETTTTNNNVCCWTNASTSSSVLFDKYKRSNHNQNSASLFLDSLQCVNRDRGPIWAGHFESEH